MKLDRMSIQRPIGVGIQNVSLLEVINYSGRYIYIGRPSECLQYKKKVLHASMEYKA